MEDERREMNTEDIDWDEKSPPEAAWDKFLGLADEAEKEYERNFLCNLIDAASRVRKSREGEVSVEEELGTPESRSMAKVEMKKAELEAKDEVGGSYLTLMRSWIMKDR